MKNPEVTFRHLEKHSDLIENTERKRNQTDMENREKRKTTWKIHIKHPDIMKITEKTIEHHRKHMEITRDKRLPKRTENDH